MKFSLGRKQGLASGSPLTHVKRPIPTISISIESDDDYLQEDKLSNLEKKSTITKSDNQQMLIGEDNEQDNESTQFASMHHRSRSHQDEALNLSNMESEEKASTSSPLNTSNIDGEAILTRKESKIGTYWD